jgi:hypothetical protein
MLKPRDACKGLLSLLIFLAGFDLASAQPVMRELSGTVIAEDSITPLSKVTIVNTRSRELTVSNPVGNFTIQVAESDSLMVTFIGFAPHTIAVSSLGTPGSKVKIYMKSSVYQLKPISFTIQRVPRVDHEHYQRIFNRPKPTAMSPISALYERFSKRGKELRKLEEDYNEYEYQKLEMRRYRDAIFPAIMDDSELIRLIVHCRLSRYFVQSAIEYDFIFAVRECMKTFTPSRPE